MADILSRDEIDALLEAVSTGEVTDEPGKDTGLNKSLEPVIKLYNFNQPIAVSPKQRGILQMVHERFARGYGRALTSHLSMGVEVKLTGLEPMSWSEYEPTLPNPSTIVTAQMEGLNGRQLWAMYPQFGFAVIDRLMGGSGSGEILARPFTEIEQNLVDETIDIALHEMEIAWERIVGCKISVDEKTTNAQLIQYIAPEAMLVSISMEIHFRETTGEFKIAYPTRLLDAIQDHARQRTLGDDDNPEAAKEARALKRSIDHIPVISSVRLGSVPVRVEDIFNLQVGDVLLLDRQIHDPLDMEVTGKTRFKGFLGVNRDKLAFAVFERV